MTKKGLLPKETPKEREARLAEALRANLRKRKEQKRAREIAPLPGSPLMPEEFAASMESFNVGARHIAVAVSGGPDSMALAWCLKAWAQAHGKKVIALIVDHQLRPESSAEVLMVKGRLEALGIETEVLTWEHPAVPSRVHVKARQARYALLIEACKKRGIADLFLAHQKEDQAETILMRFSKGSGIDGLAGMAPVTMMKGVRLLRPFLGFPKDRLIATCAAAGLETVTDPSNAKERYARARLRKVMPLLAGEGMTVERLVDLGERARETAEALDDMARKVMRVAVQVDQAGVASINLEQLRSAPQAVALRVLGILLQSFHEAVYPPERASLFELLKALCEDAPMGARTLHGCVVNKGDRFATLIREYEAVSDVTPIEPGETVIWDGRWEVRLEHEADPSPAKTKALGTHERVPKARFLHPLPQGERNPASLPSFTVRALGTLTHEEVDRLAPGLRRTVPKGRARAVLPAIWQGDRVVIIPDLTGAREAFAHAKVISRPENAFAT